MNICDRKRAVKMARVVNETGSRTAEGREQGVVGAGLSAETISQDQVSDWRANGNHELALVRPDWLSGGKRWILEHGRSEEIFSDR